MMRPCRECGQPASTMVVRCPACGAEDPTGMELYERRWAIALLAGLVLALLVLIGWLAP
jgi:hypothetical protein